MPTVRPSPLDLITAADLRLLRPRKPLVRVRPAVYADAAEWHALAPWDRYLARVHAVALAWREPVFMLESACVLQGGPVFGEPRDIHVLSTRVAARRHGDVVVHSCTEPKSLVAAAGTTMTDVATTAVDLARVLPPAFGLAVADAALRRLGMSGADLELGRSQPGRRGLRRLAWVVARADGASESSGESVSRAVIEWLGYPPPVLQAEFHLEGVRDRTDFWWPEHTLIGESDGYGKYDAADAAASKALFIAEKRREDRLRRAGNGFARWDWADALNPASLDTKLARAGLPRTGTRSPVQLATLRSNPRSLPAAHGARNHPESTKPPAA